jgi:RNA polymerase sigma factor (sigma-70 family)
MTPSTNPDRQGGPTAGSVSAGDREWSDRCSHLFEEMRRPSRAMLARAYGRALSHHEFEDVYSSAWAAILSALRTRGRSMSDEELRAYTLTAVASHASKEMRRRSRKRTGPIGAEAEQVLSDRHSPLPDEIALGTEARAVARDLLTSLPQRRRAVMLLRYGWGLSPAHVCALVPGLSPRAYRKEVTRGIEELIQRLRLVESGEWCEAREPLIRDLVAGTADESTRRQALEHLEHCRSCADLAARLSSHLHEVGGMIVLGAVAGSIGVGKLALVDRIAGLLDGGRESISGLAGRAQEAAGSASASVGGHGPGALGAGITAKVAGVSSAGKAVLACLSAGAAATACVAAGVVPGVSLNGADGSDRGRSPASAVASESPAGSGDDRRAAASVVHISHAVASNRLESPAEEEGIDESPEDPEAPDAQPPVVAPPVEEFDPVAAQATSSSAVATEAPSSGTNGTSSGISAAHDEFGP